MRSAPPVCSTRHGLHAPAPGQGWEVGFQERAHTAQLPNTKRGFASSEGTVGFS